MKRPYEGEDKNAKYYNRESVDSRFSVHLTKPIFNREVVIGRLVILIVRV